MDYGFEMIFNGIFRYDKWYYECKCGFIENLFYDIVDFYEVFKLFD